MRRDREIQVLAFMNRGVEERKRVRVKREPQQHIINILCGKYVDSTLNNISRVSELLNNATKHVRR